MDDDLGAWKEATAAAVLRGPGTTTPEQRQAVARGEPPEGLRALVEKVRARAYEVSDEDLASLRGRYTEDQIFELVVAAAFGAADERLRAGLRALEEA
jgi:alkylhydroperoxidase family enzyme